MPANRTQRVQRVKERLVDRLHTGMYRPGDRFLSNRDIAEQFGVSYQTAHRVVAELCAEGLLVRRPQSGTYVPGGAAARDGVQLVFHGRAARDHSFGAKLLATLIRRLDLERIAWQATLVDDAALARLAAELRDPDLAEQGEARRLLDPARLPIIWECPVVTRVCAAAGRPAVLINDQPQFGLQALWIDSVSTDDFSGGACAAELLQARAQSRGGYVVVAGPADDTRSQRRVEGFLSVQPAEVVVAGSWFFDEGMQAAPRVAALNPRAVFCVNDQLASAIVAWYREQDRPQPPIVGFDDAPVAEQLNLTTIGIPWDELAEAVVRIVRQRLSGDRSVSSRQIFRPRPVLRGYGAVESRPRPSSRRKTHA